MNNPLSSTEAAELAALIAKATDRDLIENGQYFTATYNDLTQCYHGDAGNYCKSADGKLVAFLWNNRHRILATIQARDREDAPLPIKLPLDSGPLNVSRAILKADVDSIIQQARENEDYS